MANVSHATIHVINGEELGDTPLVSLHQLGKRGPRSGETLLVFMDLPGATPQVCAEITRALTDGFARAPGGVTSALRLAVKLANDKLLQMNKGMLANQRLEGSLACAVASDESVVIALAGPAIAYVRTSAGAFERIDAQGDAARQVLGVSPVMDVSFDNVMPQPGTTFLLTGERSFLPQNDNLVNACMNKGEPRMVAGFLNANVKQGRMSGVAFSAALPEKGRVTSAAPPRAEPAYRAPAATTTVPPTRKSQAPERELAVDVDDTPEPMLERGGRALSEGLADAGANVRGGLNQVAQSMKRSMTAFGGKMLPDTEAFEDKAKRSKTITFALVATAVLLPIIIVSFIVPLYYQFSGEAERRERVQAIDVLVEKAKGSSAPADIKANWSEVLKQVGDYEARYVEDAARYGDAKIQARTQLDNLAKITRVQTSVLTQFQNQARRRITASALGVYGLNLDLGTAEYMAVNANRTELSGKPVALQYVREISGQLGLVDVAWATNQDSRWRTEGAILFGAGSVYEYSSATGRAAPLRLPPTNEAGTDKIVAGELYNNQVYLLDTSIGQIWRYPLGTGGFGRSTSYFRAAFNPLRQGIDLGIDGAIYVLLNNGSIVKYFNRQPQDFKMAGMPEPIGRAVAMAVTGNDPARGFIYVLDAQNGAVLQFDKSGQFLRQFRGPGEDFVNANDLAYDAATQTIYVITADRLYAFKTPAS